MKKCFFFDIGIVELASSRKLLVRVVMITLSSSHDLSNRVNLIMEFENLVKNPKKFVWYVSQGGITNAVGDYKNVAFLAEF